MTPDFIRICEDRVNDQLRIRQGLVVGATLTTDGTQKVVLPADWLEFDSLRVNGEPLELIPVDKLYSQANIATGQQRYYAIRGNYLLLSPTPGSTPVTITIDYYAKIPFLSDTITSNWLLEKNSNIYLYGSLVSGYQYLLNTKQADYWGTLYTQAVDLAKAADVRALASGSPFRMRMR
jgi:hypothetical protein